jgi:Zn-dependent protease/CBS domain-containing protein
MNDQRTKSQPARAPRGSGRISGSGFRLGRAFGVDIRVDWSLLIIFALITGELGLAVFPSWHPGWHPALVWATALAAAIAFFASILAHELSHAIVANRTGIPVRSITLFLFGGVAHMEAEPGSPKAEFWMAIVGPITSLVIGVAATFIGIWVAGDPLRAALASGEIERAQVALTNVGPGATLLLWLGPINVLLGLFNVIPGFPLDGGRVLRSILWAITKDLRKATRWASRVGQVFAWTLMGLGVLQFFTGNLIGGLWLLLIGWFLNNAARASYQHLLIRGALENVPVSRMMRSSFLRVDPQLSVDRFAQEYALTSEQLSFPVEDPDRGLLGLVSLDDVSKLDRDLWATTPVAQIMRPVEQLSILPPDAEAGQALQALMREDVDQILIGDRRHLLGLLSRGDLMRWLNFHEWDVPA